MQSNALVGRVAELGSLGGMNTTPLKPDRRILKWSAAVFFVALWLVPIIPVNNGWGPLCFYIGVFIGRLVEGYFFAAAGYCVVLILFASVTFLVSVTLGWLVERAILFVRARRKKDDHEIAA